MNTKRKLIFANYAKNVGFSDEIKVWYNKFVSTVRFIGHDARYN